MDIKRIIVGVILFLSTVFTLWSVNVGLQLTGIFGIIQLICYFITIFVGLFIAAVGLLIALVAIAFIVCVPMILFDWLFNTDCNLWK